MVRQLAAEGLDPVEIEAAGDVDARDLLALVAAGGVDDEDLRTLEQRLEGSGAVRYLFREGLGDGRVAHRPGWTPIDARQPATLVRSLLRDALRESDLLRRRAEARVRSLIDAVGSLVVGLDPEGRVTEWNPAARLLWGRSREEVLGLRFVAELVGHRERDDVQSAVDAVLRGEDVPPRQIPLDPRDHGEPRIVQWHFTPLVEADDRIAGVLAIGRDVTEQEKAEHELRLSREELRLLARHLSSVREAERSDIGREIHDQLGQSLTALKLHLSWFGTRGPVPPDIEDWIDRMGRMIDGTLESVRRISRNLRPHVLEDLGFLAAVRWQAEEFAKRFGIPCRLRCELENLDLPQTSSTQLFRILQESLTNVARHAEATQVFVEVTADEDQVELRVEDDGRGFDPNRIGVSTSVGLVGMRERALICGGEVSVTPGERGGTRVVARFPLGGGAW